MLPSQVDARNHLFLHPFNPFTLAAFHMIFPSSFIWNAAVGTDDLQGFLKEEQEQTGIHRLFFLLKEKQLLNILTSFTSDDRHKLIELSPEILPSEYTYHKRVQLISSKLTEAYMVKD